MFYEKNKNLDKSYSKFVQSGVMKYRSKVMPIWCPGCGHFAVAHALMGALNELEIPPKDVAIASGIGCSGRFPPFLNCYGLHGCHGRSLPSATGIKLGNEALTVFAVGGDGDGLGIGGGHIPHAARNNIDITYLLLDNSIYGLTKGQTSPTSTTGTVSKTTPYGNQGFPLDPILLTLSYGAAFVSRTFSGYPDQMKDVIKAAILHKGFSFVHILSPCVTFNKKQTYDLFYEKSISLRKNYLPNDRAKAISYAIQEKHIYLGIFYNQERLTY